MKDLRILHVHNVANVATNLVAGFQKLNLKAELYDLIRFDKKRFPKPIRKMLGIILAFIELFKFSIYIRIHRFDIIHIHYGTNSYLALFNNIPFYLHLHGTDIRDFNRESIKGALVLQGIKKAKALFYSTPDLYKIIKPIRSDAIYLPNPINTDFFSPHITFSKSDQIDIFNISKLDKNKGIEKQFSIIEDLLNQKQELVIAIFNFGNIAEKYTDKLKFYRSKNVQIFGKVQHRDMIDIINNSRIIIGQMSIGSLGCSELEAMACGKPVVCHIKDLEMYSTPPPVISVSNTSEAEERILELLRNPNLAYEIGKKARKWVEENHDYVNIAKKLLNYYQQDIKIK